MFTVLLVLTSAAAHTQDGLGQPVQAAAQSDPAVVTQVPAQASPAHIALVEGSATVDRDGLSQPAAPNAPFLPGDRLRTARGRAEAFFADGTILDVDEQTTVDLQAPDLVRVASGRIIPGCNIENAAYPATVCAERVALTSAYAAGEREIVALAVIADTPGPVSPCGTCRQVILELAPRCIVVLANTRGQMLQTTPQALLPRY